MKKVQFMKAVEELNKTALLTEPLVIDEDGLVSDAECAFLDAVDTIPGNMDSAIEGIIADTYNTLADGDSIKDWEKPAPKRKEKVRPSEAAMAEASKQFDVPKERAALKKAAKKKPAKKAAKAVKKTKKAAPAKARRTRKPAPAKTTRTRARSKSKTRNKK